MFKRKGFYANEEDFDSLNAYFRHLELGFFEITSNKVKYTNSSISLEISKNKITKAIVVNENSYKTYTYILIISLLLILGSFLYYAPLNLKNIFMITVFIFIYALIYFPTLYKRKWLKVIYKDGGKNNSAYFSFDWRISYFLFPWSRQSKPLEWIINRGDCKHAADLINKELEE